MKVIDLKDRTIFVDDIIQLYIEKEYSPERYILKTTNGKYLVDREDYFKVKDYLLSLNEKDKKIEKLETYNITGNVFLEDCCFKYIPIDKEKLTANEQVFVNKINEIIDYIMEDK